MTFLPWYNEDLILFLNSHLKPHFNVFEYGGGNSTLYYSNLVNTVSTIETRKEWLDFVLLNKVKENIEIKLCQNLPNFSKEIANFNIKKFYLNTTAPPLKTSLTCCCVSSKLKILSSSIKPEELSFEVLMLDFLWLLSSL